MTAGVCVSYAFAYDVSDLPSAGLEYAYIWTVLPGTCTSSTGGHLNGPTGNSTVKTVLGAKTPGRRPVSAGFTEYMYLSDVVPGTVLQYVVHTELQPVNLVCDSTL